MHATSSIPHLCKGVLMKIVLSLASAFVLLSSTSLKASGNPVTYVLDKSILVELVATEAGTILDFKDILRVRIDVLNGSAYLGVATERDYILKSGPAVGVGRYEVLISGKKMINDYGTPQSLAFSIKLMEPRTKVHFTVETIDTQGQVLSTSKDLTYTLLPKYSRNTPYVETFMVFTRVDAPK
jgi:hypothetical protein